MGNIIDKKCKLCGDTGFSYTNPLLRFFHIGKYDQIIMCLDCIKLKNDEKLNNKKYTNLKYILQKDIEK